MSNRDKIITVRATGVEKEEFTEYVDEKSTKYSSISDLLRSSAHREIKGGYHYDDVQNAIEQADLNAEQPHDSSFSKEIEEIEDRLDQLNSFLRETGVISNELRDVENRLDQLSSFINETDLISNLTETLHGEWLLRLPPGTKPSDISVNREGMSESEIAVLVGTADALSTVVEGYGRGEVEKALTCARSKYSDVETDHTEEGKPRYYVVDKSLGDGTPEETSTESEGFESASTA